MLRDRVAEASALLQLRDEAAWRALEAAMGDDWRDEVAALLDGDWHAQLVAAAALAIGGRADAGHGIGSAGIDANSSHGTDSAGIDAHSSHGIDSAGIDGHAVAGHGDVESIGRQTAGTNDDARVNRNSSDGAAFAQIWRAIDGASWIAPQLVACAFFGDVGFVARAEERLLGVERRPPKTIGALVRAYHRLPSPRLPVVAQLRRHDALLASEEARVGVRGVDAWLDRLPTLASEDSRARWLRQPR
jgi:hypothetical protein